MMGEGSQLISRQNKSSLSELVLKAQNIIPGINGTHDWGYKHHNVTLGQLYIEIYTPVFVYINMYMCINLERVTNHL